MIMKEEQRMRIISVDDINFPKIQQSLEARTGIGSYQKGNYRREVHVVRNMVVVALEEDNQRLGVQITRSRLEAKSYAEKLLAKKSVPT
jgi:hypothetical protein